MAQNDTLCTFPVAVAELPQSAYAQFDIRNEQVVLDFDASSIEVAYFGAVVPNHYSGRNITFTLVWCATTAITGDVVWRVRLEREESGKPLATAELNSAVSATATKAGATSDALVYTTITLTAGATYTDNLAANEAFRVQIARDATNAADTMAGDAELLRVIMREG